MASSSWWKRIAEQLGATSLSGGSWKKRVARHLDALNNPGSNWEKKIAGSVAQPRSTGGWPERMTDTDVGTVRSWPQGMYLSGAFSGNAAATDIAWAGTHTVAEDAALGTVVGGALSFVDPDAGDTGTFSITNSNLFAIDGTNVIVVGVLDYEISPSHNLNIRFTDAGGLTYDEVFAVTVTDVDEQPAENPPPEDGEIIVEPGEFEVEPTVVVVNEGIKFQGKKASGATGKFIYDIGAPAAGNKYTVRYTPDFTLLANDGVTAMVGFGLKQGNNFRLTGLKGDGGAGLKAYEIHGSNWNQTSGFTTTDGGAAAHGTQAGPNWLQFEVSADGTTYTQRTSSDGNTWADEFTDVVPAPHDNVVVDYPTFGIAVFLESADAGNFTVAIDLWMSGVVPANTVLPVVSGDLRSDKTLSTTNGTWDNSPTSYTYQWYADGVALSGKTASTCLMTDTEMRKVITCEVTAANAAGSSTPATSAATTPIRPRFGYVRLQSVFTGVNATTVFFDQSADAHVLTANGNAQVQSNKLELDGTGDFLRTPDNSVWTITGDFTLEVFGVVFDAMPQTEVLVSQYDDDADQQAWEFFYLAGGVNELRFALWPAGTAEIVNVAWTPTNGVAYDLCAELRGTDLRLYADGVMLVKETVTGTCRNVAQPLTIGATDDGLLPMNGRMSAIRWHNGAAAYASDAGYTVPSLPLPAAAPTFVAAGTGTSGTGDITPSLPAGIQEHDLLLILVESNNPPATPDGYALAPDSAFNSSANGTMTRQSLFWKRATASEAAPTIADTGDHQVAMMFAIRHVVRTGDPWDVYGKDVVATTQNAITFPSVTTTVPNCLIILAVTNGGFSGHDFPVTNANLSELVWRGSLATVSGNDGAVGLYSGVKKTAGATGTTAATIGGGGTGEQARYVMALKPQ